jgi:hypothetical protein
MFCDQVYEILSFDIMIYWWLLVFCFMILKKMAVLMKIEKIQQYVKKSWKLLLHVVFINTTIGYFIKEYNWMIHSSLFLPCLLQTLLHGYFWSKMCPIFDMRSCLTPIRDCISLIYFLQLLLLVSTSVWCLYASMLQLIHFL